MTESDLNCLLSLIAQFNEIDFAKQKNKLVVFVKERLLSKITDHRIQDIVWMRVCGKYWKEIAYPYKMSERHCRRLFMQGLKTIIEE